MKLSNFHLQMMKIRCVMLKDIYDFSASTCKMLQVSDAISCSSDHYVGSLRIGRFHVFRV